MRRINVRLLSVILIIAVMLPALFVAGFTITGFSFNVSLREKERYSEASSSKISSSEVRSILAIIENAMKSSDPISLRSKLSGIASIPTDKGDLIGEYTRTLANFTDTLQQMRAEIRTAEQSLALGDLNQASVDIAHLIELRSRGRALLNSLHFLLGRIHDQYNVNIEDQLLSLEKFNNDLQSYSITITELSVALSNSKPTTLFRTLISLNTSKREMFVNETIVVYGKLTNENGTVMPARNVTISWNMNRTVTKQTNSTGEFDLAITFPVGYPQGHTSVRATYEPSGRDIQFYLPSFTVLDLAVAYYPTILSGLMTTTNVRPTDHAKIVGNLSVVNRGPLSLKNITIELDGKSFDSTVTDSLGQFAYDFIVPETLTNGTHTVVLMYSAQGDVFAPSNTTISFMVQLLTAEMAMSVDRTTIMSGMPISVRGVVQVPAGSTPSGSTIAIYLDGVLEQNTTLTEDGSFNVVLQTDLWTQGGVHTVRVEYTPAFAWILHSQSSAQVFVLSTPLVSSSVIAAAALASSGVYVARRRKQRVVSQAALVRQPKTPTPPLSELTPEDLASQVDRESAEAKIRTSYRLAQTMIDRKLGQTTSPSETHWEYFSRVSVSLPAVADQLRLLVELFEMAEYTPYPVSDSQRKEAERLLLDLRNRLATVS